MRKITLSILMLGLCALSKAQNAPSPYQAIVAADGSGNYKTVQEAINAAPDGRTEPWLILVKNGSYDEHVVVPEGKSYIHLIGQDREKTIIHKNLNVGGAPDNNTVSGKSSYWNSSVHNPSSPVYKYEGSVVVVKGSHFYSENISYVNDWGVLSDNGPQALAMKSDGDCASFYRCKFRSFQDTWMTTQNDAYRHYVKDCWIEGAVDYFYGGGDVLLDHCTLYNVRSGSVIVAPCHAKAKYGYAFRDCIVDGNSKAADGKLKLGRPWHNSPKTVYINTLMLIPVAAEGWNNMGTIPGIFAEYGSHDMHGNALDMGQRKNSYEVKDRKTGKVTQGTCQAVLTKEEADQYTYENMIPGKDGWNPRQLMVELPSPRNLVYQQGIFSWAPVKKAIGYIVYDGDQLLGTTTSTSFPVDGVKYALKVAAVNPYGSQGKIAAL